MQLAEGASGRRAAPLHWLRDDGLAELLAALGRRRLGAGRKLALLWGRARTPLYLSTLALGTAALVAAFVHAPASAATAPWMQVITALLLVVPASELVVGLVHRLISESVPPRRLPRYALEQGIPESQRTLVVIPTLLTSAAAVVAAVEQLEQHYLANPERHAQFALLSDGPDAHSPPQGLTTKLCCTLRDKRSSALNRSHPSRADDATRFLLLHRPRQWSETEQRWIGWERKRGKLEQLIRWLVDGHAQGQASPFVDLGNLSRPCAGVRSIVTLDSDTGMPPGRLRELASIAAHPLNRPVVDPATRRVTSGYTILQPRVTVPLPTPGRVTPFHWMFSGQWGVDPYSAATSEDQTRTCSRRAASPARA